MSVLGRLFRVRDKPESPGDMRRAYDMMGGSRFGFFFGGSTSGKAVNERTATVSYTHLTLPTILLV